MKTNDEIEQVLKLMDNTSIEEELASIPPKDKLENMHNFSSGHIKKMERLFAKENRKRSIREKGSKFSKVKGATLAAVALFAIIIGSSLLNNNVSMTIFEPSNTPLENEVAYKDVWDFYDSESPTNLLFCGSEYSGDSLSVVYKNLENNEVKLMVKRSGENNFENGTKEFLEQNSLNGYPLTFNSNGKENSIVWVQGEYEFSIQSNIDIKQLQNLALLLQEVNNRIMK
jgi:hypothetical protein